MMVAKSFFVFIVLNLLRFADSRLPKEEGTFFFPLFLHGNEGCELELDNVLAGFSLLPNAN